MKQELLTVDSIYLSYDHERVPFLFNEPDTAIVLDRKLDEASALTVLPDGNLATIEDENGVVFIISQQGNLLEEMPFGKDGDYEGIEYLNGRFFVMKSNGELTSFSRSTPDEATRQETEFDGGNDVEGLGKLENDLLVACKAKGDAGSFKADGKGVYRVDSESFEIRELVIEIEEKQLEKILQARHPEIDVTDFDPSAVAVDPLTGSVYLLSADMLLAVFSSSGELEEVVPLLKKMYRQPEGIAFTPDGTLYIVSEASGDLPRLFRFSRQ